MEVWLAFPITDRRRLGANQRDGGGICDSGEVGILVKAYATALASEPATDVPLVKIVGAILGVLLVWAAVRAMFGKKK
jgi:hypothetical protein